MEENAESSEKPSYPRGVMRTTPEYVYQNTKKISQNTNQFPKTQISLPKANQFLNTQTNFAKLKSKDWALAL